MSFRMNHRFFVNKYYIYQSSPHICRPTLLLMIPSLELNRFPLNKIIFSSLANIIEEGAFQIIKYNHNVRVYSLQRVNVWCGILFVRVVGQYFMEKISNEKEFFHNLETLVSPFLNQNYITTYFVNRTTDLFTPQFWQTIFRSSVCILLWSTLYRSVYSNDPPHDREVLKQLI